MPSIPLHPRPKNNEPITTDNGNINNNHNPLPTILQTPSGLAILEIQGTINIPETITTNEEEKEEEEEESKDKNTDQNRNNSHSHSHSHSRTNSNTTNGSSSPQTEEENNTTSIETPIGKIIFPDYSNRSDNNNKNWMKRVYLYIGRYQRMTGEVKELTNPIAIIQKRQSRKRQYRYEGVEKKGKGKEVDMDNMDVDDRVEVQSTSISSYGKQEEEQEQEHEQGKVEYDDGLEIVDIVRYKLLFMSRPEPVGG